MRWKETEKDGHEEMNVGKRWDMGMVEIVKDQMVPTTEKVMGGRQIVGDKDDRGLQRLNGSNCWEGYGIWGWQSQLDIGTSRR